MALALGVGGVSQMVVPSGSEVAALHLARLVAWQ